MALDILTMGEIMLRFTPPLPQVLEQAPYFEVRPAGAESNVAITAARMGLKTGWISRLPENSLGRRAVASVQQHGVDIAGVVWTPHGRLGSYYLDYGVPPRPPHVIYDRANSTFTEMTIGEVNWDYFSTTRLFHVSGITLALSDNLRAVVRHAMTLARQSGILVSLDVNHRAKLWSTDSANQTIRPLLAQVDILKMGLDEAYAVLKMTGDAASIAQALYADFGCKVVVITNESQPVVAYDGQLHTQATYPVQVVDSIGAGDAFMGGFLCGYLEQGVAWGLKMGNALGAIKITYQGDVIWCNRDQVMTLIESRDAAFR
ncbi:MAG: sugar kinase [Chloroflexi bacterium]|nr:sugar kinase [Chloroflexota bacterium]